MSFNPEVNTIVKYRWLPFQSIIASAIIVLILAPLFQKGLFTDGYLYKGVAVNYAKGISGFWQMRFTDINMPQFVEQPPFFFFLNGIWFKLFGMSHLADKLFTVVLLGINFLVIYKLCHLFFRKAPSYFFWIILFQIVLVQVWNWSYVNQVIESLVTPLSLLGLYVFFKWHAKSETNGKTILYAVAFGVICFVLFLTKGFQSVFIAVIPFADLCLLKNKRAIFGFAGISYTILLLLLGYTIFISEGGQHWFDLYLQKRLMASLNHVGATANHHYEIIIRTLTELLGVFILLILLIGLTLGKRVSEVRFYFKNNHLALICLLVGIFGSVPFAVTLEQRGFYLTPSFCFFILAFTLYSKRLWLLMARRFAAWNRLKGFVWFSRSVLALSMVVFVLAPFTFKQQEVMLKDVETLRDVLRKGDTLSIHADMWNHISLQSELFMRYEVSLECGETHTYFLHDAELNTPIPKAYELVSSKTRQFKLYKKQTH